VVLITWLSTTLWKSAVDERSSRYAPAASSPGAGDQTIEYVEPETTDCG